MVRYAASQEAKKGCKVQKQLKGHFSGPRYFSSYDVKRPEKIESETHLNKKTTTTKERKKERKKKTKTEMRKNDKRGEIRRLENKFL